MIKNIIIFKMRCDLSAEQIEQAIARQAFVPCQPSQIKSQGWVPPRGENEGGLIEQVDGHIILMHQVESKSIPASALQKRVDEIVAHIEQTTGRKPGKGERKELKEQAFFELLPRAFSRISKTIVWLDVRNGFLVLGASSQSKADEITTLLIKALDGLSLTLLQTAMSPAVAMTHWLGTGEAPYAFTIDRECELKSTDEMKSVVRYTRHTLDIDEVRQHIGGGKVVTRMASTWVDRVSFVLTNALQLKKIEFHDVAFDDAGESGFDADVAIMTGELSAMIPDLIEALGGEMDGLSNPEMHDGLADVGFTKMTISNGAGDALAVFDAQNDPAYEQAKQIVIDRHKASISLVQRELRIGYNRAARLIERMEVDGIVGTMDATGSREVLA